MLSYEPGRMLLRTNFVEPCLSDADKPPSDPGWLHEIKHDGYRLMARRGAAGVRLHPQRTPRFAPMRTSNERAPEDVLATILLQENRV